MTPEAPDDVAALKALLAEMRAALVASEAALAERTAALARVEEARRRLELIVDELRRARFGARSEKRDPEQYALPLEDIELAQGVLDAAQERADATLEGSRPERRPVKRNRGQLPAHLPRVERVIEPGSTSCPCGCGPMARIGEDVSERLDVVPAQFRVLVTRRPRYACRRCSGAVVQAPAPSRPIPREPWPAGAAGPRPRLEVRRPPAFCDRAGSVNASGGQVRASARDRQRRHEMQASWRSGGS